MLKPYIVAAGVLCSFAANAQSLFDAGFPDRLFTVGLRAGVNSSNVNLDKDIFNSWNVNSWGTGFELGAVVNINLRNFFTLQPGFYYESRSGNYAYDSQFITEWAPDGSDPVTTSYTQLGHFRNYNITIPILAQLRLSLIPGAVWSIDAGPYFSWRIGSKKADPILFQEESFPGRPGALEEASLNKYDYGFKFGTGLNFLTHFYIGIHYSAGARHAWNIQSLGGRHKVWSVTAGYDF